MNVPGNAPIVDKPFSSHSAPYYQYHLGVSYDGSVSFSVAVAGVSAVAYSPPNTWAVGKWWHLVGTYDGMNVILYVNGTVVASSPAQGPINDFGGDLYIGRFGNLQEFTPGHIDEVSLYSKALKGEEVLAAYNAGSAGKCVARLPIVLRQPRPQRHPTGRDMLLEGAAAGAPPLAYQWLRNGSRLVDNGQVSGATTSILRVSHLAAEDAGQYTLSVSNEFGTATSDPATVEIVSVTEISPAASGSAGGLPVLIHGTGFHPGSVVTFGNVPSPGVQFVRSNLLVALTPALAPGNSAVSVSTDFDESAEWGGSFVIQSEGSGGGPVTIPRLRISLAPDFSAVLSWSDDLNPYELQRTEDLTNPRWTAVASAPTRAGGSNIVSVPSLTKSFFRLAQTRSGQNGEAPESVRVALGEGLSEETRARIKTILSPIDQVSLPNSGVLVVPKPTGTILFALDDGGQLMLMARTRSGITAIDIETTAEVLAIFAINPVVAGSIPDMVGVLSLTRSFERLKSEIATSVANGLPPIGQQAVADAAHSVALEVAEMFEPQSTATVLSGKHGRAPSREKWDYPNLPYYFFKPATSISLPGFDRGTLKADKIDGRPGVRISNVTPMKWHFTSHDPAGNPIGEIIVDARPLEWSSFLPTKSKIKDFDLPGNWKAFSVTADQNALTRAYAVTELIRHCYLLLSKLTLGASDIQAYKCADSMAQIVINERLVDFLALSDGPATKRYLDQMMKELMEPQNFLQFFEVARDCASDIGPTLTDIDHYLKYVPYVGVVWQFQSYAKGIAVPAELSYWIYNYRNYSNVVDIGVLDHLDLLPKEPLIARGLTRSLTLIPRDSEGNALPDSPGDYAWRVSHSNIVDVVPNWTVTGLSNGVVDVTFTDILTQKEASSRISVASLVLNNLVEIDHYQEPGRYVPWVIGTPGDSGLPFQREEKRDGSGAAVATPDGMGSAIIFANQIPGGHYIDGSISTTGFAVGHPSESDVLHTRARSEVAFPMEMLVDTRAEVMFGWSPKFNGPNPGNQGAEYRAWFGFDNRLVSIGNWPGENLGNGSSTNVVFSLPAGTHTFYCGAEAIEISVKFSQAVSTMEEISFEIPFHAEVRLSPNR